MLGDGAMGDTCVNYILEITDVNFAAHQLTASDLMVKVLQGSVFRKKLLPPVALALFYGLCALVLRPFEDLRS